MIEYISYLTENSRKHAINGHLTKGWGPLRARTLCGLVFRRHFEHGKCEINDIDCQRCRNCLKFPD